MVEAASGFLHRTLAMEVPFKKGRGADSFWQIWLKQRKSSVPLVGRHCFCYPAMVETNRSGHWRGGYRLWEQNLFYLLCGWLVSVGA